MVKINLLQIKRKPVHYNKYRGKGYKEEEIAACHTGWRDEYQTE